MRRILTRRRSWSIAYLLDLLRELVSRDLKLRYKRSILGIMWSLVTPLVQLAVFSFLFRRVLPVNVTDYPSFVFSGLLAWNWFQASIITAAGTITDNRDLIRRPGFPNAILPIVAVVSNLIHFLLALPILLLFRMYGGGGLSIAILALPMVVALQFLLTVSLAYIVATLQVTFRDTQYLLGILLLLSFYLTPIFYDASAAPAEYQFVYRLNPFFHLIGAYRSILLDGQWPNPYTMILLTLFASSILWGGFGMFRRRSNRFVEEL